MARFPDILRAGLFFIKGLIISYFCQHLETTLAHLESQKEALRRSEMKFRLRVESVMLYGIRLIDTNARFASWNSGVEKALGYQESEWVGLPFASIFTPEDLAHGIDQGNSIRSRDLHRPGHWSRP